MVENIYEEGYACGWEWLQAIPQEPCTMWQDATWLRGFTDGLYAYIVRMQNRAF